MMLKTVAKGRRVGRETCLTVPGPPVEDRCDERARFVVVAPSTGRVLGPWCRASVVVCLVLVAAPGCTGAVPPSRPTPSAALPVARDYVEAVVSGNVDAVRERAVYVRGDGARSGELVVADDLPDVCLSSEVDALLRAGVSDGSSVEMTTVGGAGIEVAQISLPDGSTVGRGIVALADGPRVQLAPHVDCDAALLAPG